MIKKIKRKFRPVFVLLLTLTIPLSSSHAAVSDAAADREFEFANELLALGLKDYAQKVIDRVTAQRPELKNRAKIVQAELLIKNGKLDEAAELAKAMPATDSARQAIMLKLANYFYHYGEPDKAKGIFEEVFKAFDGIPKDASSKQAFVEASYTQASMAKKIGDNVLALKAFNRILSAKPGDAIERKIQVDVGNLNIDLAKAEKDAKKRAAYLAAARKAGDVVTFGAFDLAFGQAISIYANIEVIKGDSEAAFDVIKTYYPDLKSIDAYLIQEGLGLSESPLASLRYTKGDLYMAQAKKLTAASDADAAIKACGKAIGEYYNVFLKYGESPWGAKAGLAFADAKEFLLEKHGKEVKIDIPPEKMVAAAKSQLRFADDMFRNKKYSEAIERYEEVLNQFPEIEPAPLALHNLAMSYAYLNDRTFPQMISNYLSERFRGAEDVQNAGNQVLKIGKYFSSLDKEKDDKSYSLGIMSDFVEGFPKHDAASKIILILADTARKSGNSEEANRLFEIIKTQYADDPAVLTALDKQAFDAFTAKDYILAAKQYRALYEASPLGFSKAQALFYAAFADGLNGQYKTSLKDFNSLKKVLSVTGSESQYRNDSNGAQIDDLLGKVIFHFASMLVKIPDDTANADKLKELAIKNYNEYLEKFPQGSFASKALYGRGKLELKAGNTVAAASTFNKLSEDYPDSAEGKSALYSLVKAALDADQKPIAQEAVNKMLADPKTYGAGEFIRVGQLMIDSEMFTEARKCLEIVKSHPDAQDDDAILQRALYYLGESYFAEGNCVAAADNLNEMLEKYPKSGLLFKIYILLGKSYQCDKKYQEARDTLKQIFIIGSKLDQMKANLLIAKIYKEEGNQKEAMSSYFSIVMFGEPTKDPDQIPVIQEAMEEVIPLGQEVKEWTKLKMLVDAWLGYFPKDEKVDEMRKLQRDLNLKAATEE